MISFSGFPGIPLPPLNLRYFILWLVLLQGLYLGVSGRDNKLIPKGLKKSKGIQLNWDFPIQRCHAGIPLGNGKQGLLLWGSDSILKITIAHAGFWDRRWTKNPDSSLNYAALMPLLLQKDEAGIQQLFGLSKDDKFKKPRQIGGALLEIPLPEGWHLQSASLSLQEGNCRILIRKKGMPSAMILIEQFTDQNTAQISFPLLIHKFRQPVLKPVSDFLKSDFLALEIPEAEKWNQEVPKFRAKGILQKLPHDPSLGIVCAWKEKHVWISSGLGSEATQGSLIGRLENQRPEASRLKTDRYWTNFWDASPRLQIPDARLREMYEFGLYKMAATSHPEGPALTLQGPFMEHYQLPPWSNDFHFNINVQMMYWPILSTGHYERMKPLWEMMRGWIPEMKRNGERFFGKPGAWFLPHATTDQGGTIGGFWTGTIDHGCLTWMAQLAWKYFRHTNDTAFLKEFALPMMEGALTGYEAQFDTLKNGNNPELGFPVSVSPEFRGSRMDAWGRNASFQLAACHNLIGNLTEARIRLGLPVPAKYLFIKKHLPAYALVQSPNTLEYPEYVSQKIGLWQGMDLVESHRHHSHLASVYPFITVDPTDSLNQSVFHQTYYQWSRKGTGAWTGWSVPWASILLSRFNQPNSAISMLHWGQENFINEGRGTLHDVFYPYITTAQKQTVFGPGQIEKGKDWKEIMQLDAGFGYMEAIHEILFQHRKDGLHVLPVIPYGWKDFRFEGLHTEDGLILGATVANGKVTEIRIRSTYPTKIRLHHGLAKFTVNGIPGRGLILEDRMGKDEIHILRLTE